MIFRNKGRIKEYWKKLMESSHKKISQGAAFISRCIPFARKENWRRNDKVQHGHEKNKK